MRSAAPYWKKFTLFGVWLLAGCGVQMEEFALPPGDPDAGKVTFVALGCTRCHSVAGSLALHPLGEADTHFELGGRVSRVRTYGDLVTSIINPAHKISMSHIQGERLTPSGKTRMIEINRVMTVTELVDITSYLRDTYEVVPPTPTYLPYPPGI